MFQVDLDKLRNDTIMKSSGVGGANTKVFDLLKIWATSLNIRVKMTPNFA